MTQQAAGKMEKRYEGMTPESRRRFEEASRYIVGGESGTGLLPPYPSYIKHADGCHLYDVDGRRLVDFVNGMFVLPLGHNHPAIRKAIKEQLDKGTMFSLPSELVTALARELVERTPSLDQVRFTVSGSEAVMFAVRVARVYTGRTKIAKMQGAYHGTVGPLVMTVTGEPGPLTEKPDLPGMVPGTNANVVVLPFNHPEEAVRIIDEHAKELAVVVLEPVMGALGGVPPKPGFLEALREATSRHGIVLLFDEMVSYSIARGGAQAYYGVTPDMTTTGKSIGGGMPIALFGGRADIMALTDLYHRDGPRVGHTATYGSHPLALAAGYAAMQAMNDDLYAQLHRLGHRLRSGLSDLFTRLEVPMQVTGVGHLFGFYWTPQPVWDFRTSAATNQAIINEISLGLITRGYFAGNRGRGCVSTAMKNEHIDGFIEAMEGVLKDIDVPKS